MDPCEVFSYNLDQAWRDSYLDDELPATEVALYHTATVVEWAVVIVHSMFMFPLSCGATMLALDSISNGRPISVFSALGGAWRKILPLLDTLIWSSLYMT